MLFYETAPDQHTTQTSRALQLTIFYLTDSYCNLSVIGSTPARKTESLFDAAQIS